MDRTARRHTRRGFLGGGLGLAGLGLLTGCGILARPAPSTRTIPRLGFLAPTAPLAAPSQPAFLEALRDLGYVEGETILIEYRWAGGDEGRLPALAAELVALDVDVIYGWNTVAARAAKDATGTIPIVFGPSNDPIAAGLVSNLARPDGNATGLKFNNEGMSAKRLQLLREGVPELSRVAALGYAGGLSTESDWAEIRAAGQQLGLGLRRRDVQAVDEFEGAFGAMAAEGAEALITLGDSFLARNAGRVVGLAARHRLAAMYEHRVYPDAGGLQSYGANIEAAHRRAAAYVNKILKGARPADLPVEQPTTFDFVVNLKTAQALGFAIPDSVLQQATELIQ